MRLAAARAHDAVGDEGRGRDDHGVGLDAERTLRAKRSDARERSTVVDIEDRDLGLDRRSGREVSHERAVAVGPRHDGLGIDSSRGLAAGEVEDACPSVAGRGGREGVVVPTGVVAQPAKARRGQPAHIEPRSERLLVQCRDAGVIAAT